MMKELFLFMYRRNISKFQATLENKVNRYLGEGVHQGVDRVYKSDELKALYLAQ